MLRFPARRPGLGLEITSSALRLATVSVGSAGTTVIAVNTVDLPAGMVGENYSSPNISDHHGFSALLRESLDTTVPGKIRRTAVSLPDGIFRVQALDFDELPSRAADRERLIRWRLEKAATFDLSGAVLQYQIGRRQDRGITVLACAAKRDVIAQYETVLTDLGLEPWAVGVSSFYTVNFYHAALSRAAATVAVAVVARDSFTVVVMEQGQPRFYRFKELKGGSASEARVRLVREIDDSLHFYTHMDRSQQPELGSLSLAGDPALLDAVARELRSQTSLAVEILSPSTVLSSGGEALPDLAGSPAMAAALGAGSSL